jgi:hypothetical protein
MGGRDLLGILLLKELVLGGVLIVGLALGALVGAFGVADGGRKRLAGRGRFLRE